MNPQQSNPSIKPWAEYREEMLLALAHYVPLQIMDMITLDLDIAYQYGGRDAMQEAHNDLTRQVKSENRQA